MGRGASCGEKSQEALFLNNNMILPDEYKTGNAKTDALIEKALIKDIGNKFKQTQAYIEKTGYNKYGIADKEDRTYKDGQVFASKKEMQRYDYLLQIERAGLIRDLQTQVPFILQEEFVSRQWGEVKPIIYVADFTYTNISYRKGFEGRECVEDSKGGMLTKEYKLKRKMFLYKYGSYLFFEVK